MFCAVETALHEGQRTTSDINFSAKRWNTHQIQKTIQERLVAGYGTQICKKRTKIVRAICKKEDENSAREVVGTGDTRAGIGRVGMYQVKSLEKQN